MKNSNPIVAYIGPVAFPHGGAAARRMLGNAMSLRSAGFDVIIGSGQMTSPQIPIVSQQHGFEVHSLGERSAEHHAKPLRHLLYLSMGKKTVRWLEKLSPRPIAIMLYSGYSAYLRQLLPWCKKHGIPLIFDAVEWYDPPSKLKGLISPYYWNIELAMRHYCVHTKNIIAISSYLQGYYSKRGCTTIKIPPTLDTREITPNLTSSAQKVLTLGYTGIPGHKDLFDNYLEAIVRIDPEGKKIKLYVAGVTEKQILAFPAMLKRKITTLPNSIETLGLTTQKNAINLIRSVDYSLLLRPQQRYAQAGFPTKLVESMAMGTPVIANITSDLGDYLNDGIEGIVCKDHSVVSLMQALDRALSLTSAERQAMRVACRQQAETSFDYRNYVEPITKYFNTLLV